MLADAFRNAILANAPLKWLDAFLVATSTSVCALFATAGLYVAKAALGIDLMSGPSPLHDLLYWIVA